ncbi:MAG: FtsX-like permease family protein, partial [Silvibacterium sp.]
PGVTRAAGSFDIPFQPSGNNGDFSYDGQPEGTAEHNPFADFHYVTPGYFATVETPLLQGRDFTRQDRADSQKVIIIDRSMAQRFWPGQSPIGKRIHCCSKDGNYTVIGVVGDVRFAGPAAPAGLAFYMSADQNPQQELSFVLRTPGDPMALAETARRAVASIDPGQAVSNITTLNALAQQSIAGQKTSTTITTILGCLALLLASIGVYGVMAYSVSRREREFGIRMALGANRGNILTLLFAGVLRLILVGMAVGAALALGMRVWIDSLLGTNGTSPFALVAAALLLCVVAALATLLPARHAMYVEPMQALRTE